MTRFTLHNILHQRKVRYRGLVHYAGIEKFDDFVPSPLVPVPLPFGARCGAPFDGEETPAYLRAEDDVLVTCVACIADRRRS